jgi:transposase
VIGSSRAVRVWAYGAPTDLRKGYNGLTALVERELKLDVLSGDCFLFVSRDRHSAKVLLWDGTGLCIYQKRMSRGQFAALWETPAATSVKLTMSELALFLEGANLRGRLPLSPQQVSVKRG